MSDLEENPALWYNDQWGCTGFDLETKYQWHAEDSAGLLKKPRPNNCRHSRRPLLGKRCLRPNPSI